MSPLSFPARFEYLDPIRKYVGEKAQAAGFGDKDVYSIQLAADEAASNIIEHAYADKPDGSIQVTCEFDIKVLKITFLDQGRPFDPSKVKKPDLKAHLSKRKIGGLGVYLMRQLMDEVHYHVTPSGNVLVLIKRKD